jgi:hypothetical protein
MNDLWNDVREWWRDASKRDRWVVIFGAAITLGLMSALVHRLVG